MDKLTRYRGAVRHCLLDWYAYLNRATPRLDDIDCLIDEERDNYMITFTGWRDGKRHRQDYIFVRIREGKIWVEEDRSDDPVAEELLRLGVPMEDIVLGLLPPDVRHHSGYGVRGPFAPPNEV